MNGAYGLKNSKLAKSEWRLNQSIAKCWDITDQVCNDGKGKKSEWRLEVNFMKKQKLILVMSFF